MIGDGSGRTIQFATPDIQEDEISAVVAVLKRGWITTGHECFAFERELADFLGAPHVVAMSSCTAALQTAVASLDLPPGSPVGVPTWTFASSALVAVHQGCVPMLLDVEPATLNLSVESVEAAIADGVRAIMAVHFGGVPVSAEVRDLAATNNVPVIEDAAHALGATDDRGRLWGKSTIGACFSFYATKNLTSAEGGALATEDAELARFARAFRQHGMSADAWARYKLDARPRYDIEVPGIKANLSDVLAALGRAQLRRFDESQRRRRALTDRYRANLLGVVNAALVPREPVEGSADHLVIARLADGIDRDMVLTAFADARVGASVHFVPLHHMSWFQEHARVGPTGLHNAEAAAPAVISLPMHALLSFEDVDRVCSVLVEVTGG